ncbi:hypothetical protein CONPUDRAFT_151595 [Coniophora puteana RWD-64-598 SS2]|uniref:Uncharacterized protein n=1 Tax=Coniophora puteana (strain RWD-64-598) TaxID=741705 RepID=A0A5M3N116_CONPW|nr:uncharacterized protein CONPUDRAFT_151595 [Coniophora puteana RWD-64-598 SS2]EIW84581.1 hypothetical protein CONPUDRAFT_151595 [Coniophora puteana RWD-64-598 SS2]
MTGAGSLRQRLAALVFIIAVLSISFICLWPMLTSPTIIESSLAARSTTPLLSSLAPGIPTQGIAPIGSPGANTANISTCARTGCDNPSLKRLKHRPKRKHTSGPIRLDRSILPILESLHSDDLAYRLATSHKKRSGRSWTPFVDRLPEARSGSHRSRHSRRDDTHDSRSGSEANLDAGVKMSESGGATLEDLAAYDAQFCPGPGPCRFLLPYRIGEQESKARQHLAQVARLAEVLNRTLVLPNVGRSRVGACARWPFGAYYDAGLQSLPGGEGESGKGEENGVYARGVDLEKFRAWVHGRPTRPALGSVQLQTRASVSETDINMDLEVVAALPNASPMSYTPCLRKLGLGSLRSSPSPPSSPFDNQAEPVSAGMTILVAQDKLHRPPYEPYPGSRVIDLIFKSPAINNAQVLVLEYDLRHPIFSPADIIIDDHLRYAPWLHTLAHRLIERAKPNIGVHWRMEGVPPQNLEPCARDLVNVLSDLALEDGSERGVIWLATDYPGLIQVDNSVSMPSTSMKSTTFTSNTSAVEPALDVLRSSVRPGGLLEGWKLTELDEQIRHAELAEKMSEKLTVDEGLLEDSGVVDARQNRFMASEEHDDNIVQLFGESTAFAEFRNG